MTSKSVTAKKKPDQQSWVKKQFREWAAAAGKNDCDLLGIDNAPEWVFNAWMECVKIVFPCGLPSAEKWDAHFLGIWLGRLYALEHFYAGRVPLGHETKGDWDQLVKRGLKEAKKVTPAQRKALTIDLETKFRATREAIAEASKLATESSYQDAQQFQKGLAQGIKIEPEELATSRTFQRHTRTYFTLAAMWPAWMKCKSIREVHGHLCNAVGEEKIGNFKTFEKVCEKIGFRLRARGRPSRK